MKKTGLLLILVLITGLLMTACGCDHNWEITDCDTGAVCSNCAETQPRTHQWVEATCETPKTCSQCGKTEGEALGHSYQEATCAAPSTCSVCGAAQGEALPHMLGKWTIDGEQMHRTCGSCGHQETSALDREAYFRGNSAGHWDTRLIKTGGETFSAYALEDSVGTYLRLTEEGEILFGNGVRTFEGTLEYADYQQAEGIDIYSFLGCFDGDSKLELSYCEKDGQSYILLLTQDFEVMLVRNDEYTQAMSGIWADISDNSLIYVQLNGDRTFTAELPELLTGTWHVREIMEEFGSKRMEILLHSSSDFGGQTVKFRRYIYEDTTELSQLLKVEEDTLITSYHNRSNIMLRPVDEDTFLQMVKDLQLGTQGLLGVWESREHTVINRENDASKTAALVGWSFDFRQDGTFLAAMDEEKTGTWEYLDRPGDYCRYNIFFSDAPSDRSWSVTLYDDGRMSVSCYTEKESRHIDFERPQERISYENEGDLPGTWISTVYNVTDVETQKENSCTREGDFITFHPDGTLDARLMDPYTGIWEFESTMVNGEGTDHESRIDTYKLVINGKEEPYYVNFYEENGTISLSYYEDGCSYRGEFLKELEEDRQKFIYNGMELILGDWVSTCVSEQIQGTNEIKDEYTSEYTLSVHEDGTFEYHYRHDGNGTWEFDGYNASSNSIAYTFRYYGEIPYSYRYTLRADDTLFGWDEQNGQEIGYYFQKAE